MQPLMNRFPRSPLLRGHAVFSTFEAELSGHLERVLSKTKQRSGPPRSVDRRGKGASRFGKGKGAKGARGHVALELPRGLHPQELELRRYAAKLRRGDSAADVLETLTELKASELHRQNVIHYAAAFHRLRELRQWRKALGVFLALRRDTKVFGALTHYGSHSPPMSMHADEPMEQQQLAPVNMLGMEQQRYRQLHNEALVLCGKTGQWRLAFEILHDMHCMAFPCPMAHPGDKPSLLPSSLPHHHDRESPLPWMAPDHGNFTAVLTACARASDRDFHKQTGQAYPKSSSGSGKNNKKSHDGLAVTQSKAATPWEAAMSLLSALHSGALSAAPPATSFTALGRRRGEGGADAPDAPSGNNNGSSSPLLAVHPYSYHAALSCCARAGQWSLVRGLLAKMQQQGLAVTPAALTAALHPDSGVALADALDAVNRLSEQVQKTPAFGGGGAPSSPGETLNLPASLPSVFLRNRLLSLCRRDGDWQTTLALLASPIGSARAGGKEGRSAGLSDHGGGSEEQLLTSALGGGGGGGGGGEAEGAGGPGGSAGDVVGATTALHTLAEAGQWAHALALLDGVFQGAVQRAAASLLLLEPGGGGGDQNPAAHERGEERLAKTFEESPHQSHEASTEGKTSSVAAAAASSGSVVVDELVLMTAAFQCVKVHGQRAFYEGHHHQQQQQVRCGPDGESTKETEEDEEAVRAIVGFLAELRPGGRYPVPPSAAASAVASATNAVLSLETPLPMPSQRASTSSSSSSSSSSAARRLESVRAGRKFLAALTCPSPRSTSDGGGGELGSEQSLTFTAAAAAVAVDARPYLALLRACDPASPLPKQPRVASLGDTARANDRGGSSSSNNNNSTTLSREGARGNTVPGDDDQASSLADSEAKSLLAAECVGILRDLDAIVLSKAAAAQQQGSNERFAALQGPTTAAASDNDDDDPLPPWEVDEGQDGEEEEEEEDDDDDDSTRDLREDVTFREGFDDDLEIDFEFDEAADDDDEHEDEDGDGDEDDPALEDAALHWPPAAAADAPPPVPSVLLTPAAAQAAAVEACALAARGLSVNGAWQHVTALFLDAVDADDRHRRSRHHRHSQLQLGRRQGGIARRGGGLGASPPPLGQGPFMLSPPLVEASMAAAAATAHATSSSSSSSSFSSQDMKGGGSSDGEEDTRLAAAVVAAEHVVRTCRSLGVRVGARELNGALRVLLADKQPLLAFALADALAVATDDVQGRDSDADGGCGGGGGGGGDDGGGGGDDVHEVEGVKRAGSSPSLGQHNPLIAPSLATYHLAMSAAISAGEGTLALGVLQDMRRRAASGGRDGGRAHGGEGEIVSPNDTTHRLAKRALRVRDRRTESSEEEGALLEK